MIVTYWGGEKAKSKKKSTTNEERITTSNNKFNKPTTTTTIHNHQQYRNNNSNDDNDAQPTGLPSARLRRVGEVVDAAYAGRGARGGEDGGGVGEVAVGRGTAGVGGVLHHATSVWVRQLVAGRWAPGARSYTGSQSVRFQ